MLKISREVELGLLLMTELARQPGEVIGLREWSESRGLPYRFLSKVAVKLKKAKLLKSREGREGGYQLAKTAKKIKAGEVIGVLEGREEPVRCMSVGKCDCMKFCGHRDLMVKLAGVVERHLNQVSLQELC